MTNSERAFLALTETLNFTRAAEKIYITQQGLSDHIRKLEREYDTVLVIRKPQVRLTDAGRALQQLLLREEAMEEDVRRTIAEINTGDTGDVYLGIAVSRVRAFADDIVVRYHQQHPHVRIHIESDITMEPERMLLQNQLDGIIGVNAEPHRELVLEPLFDDPLYLAVPEHIVRERTGDAKCVNIADYADLPFIRDIGDSTTSRQVDAFLTSRNIQLNNIIEVSEYAVQASLCRRLDAAMFCAKSFAFYKEGSIAQAHHRTLEIEGLRHSVNLTLVKSKSRSYPKCVLDFFDTIKESLNDFYRNVI